jgi:hypothetical protein
MEACDDRAMGRAGVVGYAEVEETIQPPASSRAKVRLADKDLPLRRFERFIREQTLSPRICKVR